MKWCVVILGLILGTLSACATGDQGWSRTGRSHCLGQPNEADPRPVFVLFCAESP